MGKGDSNHVLGKREELDNLNLTQDEIKLQYLY